MSTNPLNDITRVYLEQVASQEVEIEEGMTMKDFKANRRKLKRREASADAKKRGHVGKEWYNSGRTYSPDEAKSGRAKLDDAERSTRHRSSIDPEGEDSNYSADKTKNPKKLRKQKAMGELGESSHLETDMKKRSEANEKARKEIAKSKAHADMVKAARKHFDESKKGDGNLANNYPPYDKVTRGDVIAGATGNDEMGGKKKKKVEEGNDGNLANNYPPYDKVTRGDVIAGRLGKDQMGGKKKKVTKEGYSNWRQDLSEVIKDTETEKKITEKQVNNKIVINPKLDLGEAVENLGGTLLEMIEVENFDSIFDDLSESEIFLLSDDLIEEVVEEFFYECLEEGYDLDQVENVLIESIELTDSILTEAKVTLGHDTKIKSDRLGKVKSAVKKVGGAIARGAGYVAGAAVRGAKAAGREFKAGYQRGRGGSSGSSTSSTSSSASSSGSSSSETGTKRPGLLGRIGSALKSGLKRAVAKGARAVSRGARNVARKVEGKPSTSSASTKPAPKKAEKPADPWEGSYKKSSEVKTKPKPKASTKKAPTPKATTKAPAKRKKKSKLDDLLASVRSESVQIDEKTLTKMEMKKREEIVKSMKDKASDFEKRYPGRGKEVMYATATKMAKKVAEQTMELQPKTQTQTQQPDPRAKAASQRAKAKAIELKTRELATLRSTPAGTAVSTFN